MNLTQMTIISSIAGRNPSEEGGLPGGGGVWGRGCLVCPGTAQQQTSPSLGISEMGGTVETTSSGPAPQGGQAGQRDPAGRVISGPPAPVFYWCRRLHLLPLGAATALVRREEKIPLLGTDPPWSPEVLLDGRRAQRTCT